MAMQIAFLGFVYTAIGVLTDSSYALAAGTAVWRHAVPRTGRLNAGSVVSAYRSWLDGRFCWQSVEEDILRVHVELRPSVHFTLSVALGIFRSR